MGTWALEAVCHRLPPFAAVLLIPPSVAPLQGWLPSVIGVVPYVGLNFAVYESLKAALLQQQGGRDERDLSVSARLACGAAAGTTGQTVAYPFDVARRRLQVRRVAWLAAGLRVTVTGVLLFAGRVIRGHLAPSANATRNLPLGVPPLSGWQAVR